MIAKILIGILIGVCAGAVIGHFGKCSSGACPFTSNPYRGALWGGLIGFLFTLTSCSPPQGTENAQRKEIEPEVACPSEGEKQSEETGMSVPAESADRQKGEILHIKNESDFKSLVLNAKEVCLVDFHAAWCPPCHALAPTVSALAKKYAGRVTVCKIDVDEAQSVAQRYKIRSIPTVLFIKNGEEIDRYIGVRQENEYTARLDKMLK